LIVSNFVNGYRPDDDLLWDFMAKNDQALTKKARSKLPKPLQELLASKGF